MSTWGRGDNEGGRGGERRGEEESSSGRGEAIRAVSAWLSQPTAQGRARGGCGARVGVGHCAAPPSAPPPPSTREEISGSRFALLVSALTSSGCDISLIRARSASVSMVRVSPVSAWMLAYLSRLIIVAMGQERERGEQQRRRAAAAARLRLSCTQRTWVVSWGGAGCLVRQLGGKDHVPDAAPSRGFGDTPGVVCNDLAHFVF